MDGYDEVGPPNGSSNVKQRSTKEHEGPVAPPETGKGSGEGAKGSGEGAKGSGEGGKGSGEAGKGLAKAGDRSGDGEKKIKKKEKKQPPKRDKMTEGELCKSGKFHWKIICLLGSGGFGDVYKVVKDNDPDKTEYAMKTEMVFGDKRMLRLKVEVEALIKCNEHKNKKHFTEILDRGKTDKFKFMVMTLVGASLEDFRKKQDCDFSPSTAMQIAIQTIECLRDFHQAGWLHRDIKPQNFAHGLGEKETIVYMLDFGIAKRIFDKDKQVKKPRAKVKFLGTVRFASRGCHHCLEQGRKDDLETWIYMVFDIFDRKKGLPWKKEPDRQQVIVKKDLFIRDKAWYDRYYEENLPLMKEFHLILEHLLELDYYEEPRYEPVRHHLIQTAKKKKIDITLPLDWTVLKKDEKKLERSPDDKKEVSEEAKQEGSVDSEEDRGPFVRPAARKRTSKGNRA